MVALQIRDVPDDVRERLAELAKARGQSLQAYLLGLVTDEARREENWRVLACFEQRRDGANLTSDQVADLLAAERSIRDARF